MALSTQVYSIIVKQSMTRYKLIFTPKTVVETCQLGKLLIDIENVRKHLDLDVEDD